MSATRTRPTTSRLAQSSLGSHMSVSAKWQMRRGRFSSKSAHSRGILSSRSLPGEGGGEPRLGVSYGWTPLWFTSTLCDCISILCTDPSRRQRQVKVNHDTGKYYISVRVCYSTKAYFTSFVLLSTTTGSPVYRIGSCVFFVFESITVHLGVQNPM